MPARLLCHGQHGCHPALRQVQKRACGRDRHGLLRCVMVTRQGGWQLVGGLVGGLAGGHNGGVGNMHAIGQQ